MVYYQLLLFAVGILGLLSCANSREDEKTLEIHTSAELSPIEKEAVSLYNSLFSSSLRSGEKIEVKDVNTFQINSLRSLSDSLSNDLGIITINFKDNKGFVVMTAGDINTPLAIVDHGNLYLNSILEYDYGYDSTKFGHLESLISSTLSTYKEDYSDRKLISNAGYDVIELIEHKIKTKLDQEGPYFYPYKNKNLAGCVPVAIAQALIYYKTITWKKIKGRYINWQAIEDECVKNGGELTEDSPQELKDDLNELLWWIGLNSGTVYKKDESSTNSNTALKFISRNGYNVASPMWAYDINIIRTLLNHDVLIYMRGSRGQRYFLWWKWPSSGHAWLLDGYAKVKDRYGKEFEMVHVNWGWGSKGTCFNGYYRTGVFDYFDSNKITTREADSNASKYEYGLKISPINPR